MNFVSRLEILDTIGLICYNFKLMIERNIRYSIRSAENPIQRRYGHALLNIFQALKAQGFKDIPLTDQPKSIIDIDVNKLYSVDEAAAILSVKPVTVRRMIKREQLPVLRIRPKLYRISGGDLRNLLGESQLSQQ